MTTKEASLSTASEVWKRFYSESGVRTIESGIGIAQQLGHTNLNEIHLGLALLEDPIAQAILTTAGIDPQRVLEVLKPKLTEILNTNSPIDSGSFTAICNTALAESVKFSKADLIGTGNLLAALYQSSTLAGQALKRTLSPSGKEGISVLSRLRNATKRVEKDQEVW